MKTLLHNALRLQKHDNNLSQMLICMLTISVPLVIGIHAKHEFSVVVACLFGYAMTTAFEPAGSLTRRWFNTLGLFSLLAGALALGIFLQNHPLLFFTFLFCGAYSLGMGESKAAEIERTFLFSLTLVVAIRYMPHQADSLLINRQSVLYCLIVLGFVLITTAIQWALEKRQNRAHTALRTIPESFADFFAARKTGHHHAFIYAGLALLSAIFMDITQLQRGYWTIVIFLMLMKQDRQLNVHRTVQRLFGTILGILAVEVCVLIAHRTIYMDMLLMLAAFLTPWAVKKNYWLLIFFISLVLLLLFDSALSNKTSEFLLPLLRLRATLFACFVTIVGVALTKHHPGKTAHPCVVPSKMSV